MHKFTLDKDTQHKNYFLWMKRVAETFSCVLKNVWALRLCRGLIFKVSLAFLWCLVNVTNSHFYVCSLYCSTRQKWCFTFKYCNLTGKLHLTLFHPLIWLSYLKALIPYIQWVLNLIVSSQCKEKKICDVPMGT